MDGTVNYAEKFGGKWKCCLCELVILPKSVNAHLRICKRKCLKEQDIVHLQFKKLLSEFGELDGRRDVLWELWHHKISGWKNKKRKRQALSFKSLILGQGDAVLKDTQCDMGYGVYAARNLKDGYVVRGIPGLLKGSRKKLPVLNTLIRAYERDYLLDGPMALVNSGCGEKSNVVCMQRRGLEVDRGSQEEIISSQPKTRKIWRCYDMGLTVIRNIDQGDQLIADY